MAELSAKSIQWTLGSLKGVAEAAGYTGCEGFRPRNFAFLRTERHRSCSQACWNGRVNASSVCETIDLLMVELHVKEAHDKVAHDRLIDA